MRNTRGLSKLAIQRSARSLPDPRTYLRLHLNDWPWARLVLEHGKSYVAADLGTDWRCRVPWQCYENAMAVTKESGGRIAYVEGLCIAPFGIHLHAWNLKDGKVLDSTWPSQHLNRYFGIVFDLKWLEKTGFTNGCVFGYWNPVHEYLIRKAA